MIQYRKILFSLCLLLWSLGSATADIFVSQDSEKVYNLTYSHPGNKNNECDSVVLYQNKKEFYMDVPSVYCWDNVCKIDTLRFYWSRIGLFQRLEIKPNSQLEKANHEFFTKSDYLKLDEILRNKNSIFKSLNADEILTSTQENRDVDAFSGATRIEIDQNETVKGATLTCYTLWHWANGSICKKIQKISGEHISRKDLIKYLKDEDNRYRIFAISQFIIRKDYSSSVIKSILQLQSIESNDLLKLRMNYFENAPKSVYQSVILKTLERNNSIQNVLSLKSLLKNKNKISPNLFKDLCLYTPEFKSYHEIDLLLTLIENMDNKMKIDLAPIFVLLKKSNIIISRRAYWFLKGKNINKSQQEMIKAFEEAKSEYL
nr:hypothetical protein [uncultured Marinifilum sp.]